MSFDWNEYLRISEDIYTQLKNSGRNDEALARTAISRAYYSAINLAAENAIQKYGQSFPKDNFHSACIGYYRNDKMNPNHQTAGKLLRTLHSSRIKCDYHALFEGNLEKALESSILQAKNIKIELTKKTW